MITSLLTSFKKLEKSDKKKSKADIWGILDNLWLILHHQDFSSKKKKFKIKVRTIKFENMSLHQSRPRQPLSYSNNCRDLTQ